MIRVKSPATTSKYRNVSGLVSSGLPPDSRLPNQPTGLGWKDVAQLLLTFLLLLPMIYFLAVPAGG